MHVCTQVWTYWWALRTVWNCWTVVVRARFTPSSTPAGSNRWTSWRASTCSLPYQVDTAALRQAALTTVCWSCLCFWHKTTVFNRMPNTRCQIVLMLSDSFFLSLHCILTLPFRITGKLFLFLYSIELGDTKANITIFLNKYLTFIRISSHVITYCYVSWGW